MGNKLFVGGLSWSTTSEGLEKAFSKFGSVTSAKVITDRETARSRGFGFVEFSTEEEARAALEGMNGTVLDGRSIRVDFSTDSRGGGRGGRPRDGGSRAADRDGGYRDRGGERDVTYRGSDRDRDHRDRGDYRDRDHRDRGDYRDRDHGPRRGGDDFDDDDRW